MGVSGAAFKEGEPGFAAAWMPQSSLMEISTSLRTSSMVTDSPGYCGLGSRVITHGWGPVEFGDVDM